MADPMQLLAQMGLSEATGAASGRVWHACHGDTLVARLPIDGAELARLPSASAQDARAVIDQAAEAFLRWRLVPPPRRGELVRRIGAKLREHKAELAELVTLEVGKIVSEAQGEVQEMIDICDFAVGLSRQLYGLTIASERPGHRMMEQWLPLGPVGIITAFNFPVAVWAWNAMIALVCGDPVVWKPSEKASLCAVACHAIVGQVIEEFNEEHDDAVSDGIVNLLLGAGDSLGAAVAESTRLPLISATGSTRMGKAVAQTVAARFGRSLLELGGNNGLIVTPSANLELAVRAITFAAAGTAGQRCTTLRRLIVHRSRYHLLVARLRSVFSNLKIGDPRDAGVLVGPLIDGAALAAMRAALDASRAAGGAVHGGGAVTEGAPKGGAYAAPALVEIESGADIVRQETFAPILYVMAYDSIEEAIAIHNDVPQGLSSAIFTDDLREAELFLSAAGSDCGIVNVNIGTSGAEIGGAFGGEKATGGGRESGSDAWKSYMRRVTNTINYSTELPLAQGVVFE